MAKKDVRGKMDTNLATAIQRHATGHGIFVSYARPDRSKADSLAYRLRQAGMNVWLDRKLTGDQLWWDRVLTELRRSDALMLIVSRAALESEAWTAQCEYATRLGKPLLALIVGPVGAEPLPPDIARLKVIDYSHPDEVAVGQLVGAVMRLPSAPALPDPLPESPPAPPRRCIWDEDEPFPVLEKTGRRSSRTEHVLDECLSLFDIGPSAADTTTPSESVHVLSAPDPLPTLRHLKGQCPDTVLVGEPFSLLVSIVLAGPASARLKPFDMPPEGRDVLVVIHAPGLRLLGRQRMTVHVPPDEDSEPVMFELRADTPGPRPLSITAWLGGSYLGELLVEVTAERDRPPSANRDVLAEIATEPVDGAVSLVVRYDPDQGTYRFEFRDEDYPEEVTSHLVYEPGPRVEQLVAEMDDFAKGRSGYSAAQAKDYLVNAGAGLWHELVPERLREQFWERQQRIRQLTILADQDTVPWELLYPMDPGHDAGFLVEQFPVTRAVFGRRPIRRLSLRPARFVLPGGSQSPPEAGAEIEAMRRLLDPGHSPDAVIAALTPLNKLIRAGDFGLLHFACHNRFDPAYGSSIMLGHVPFKLTDMNNAAINHTLARSAPTVFINACRSAGLTARYTGLDSWASKFLEAGAAVFIGSLWAVRDTTGREFASELYSNLQAGFPLGKALLCARRAVASQPGDPTWLAYTAYGDPSATISTPYRMRVEVGKKL